MSEGEPIPVPEGLTSNWTRRGRSGVDVTDTPVERLEEMNKKGYEFDLEGTSPGKRIVRVNRVIISGVRNPFDWLRNLFRRGQ